MDKTDSKIGDGSMPRCTPPPPVPRNRQCLTAEPAGSSCARFSPKIRLRNQGLVLAHDRGQPRTTKKNFPAHYPATCAPSPFPQLTTLTNEHQRSDGGTRSNTHEMMSCTPEQLSYIHQNHEKPNTLVKKGVREFDRGTRERFLRKVVPRHGGGGGYFFESDCRSGHPRFTIAGGWPGTPPKKRLH